MEERVKKLEERLKRMERRGRSSVLGIVPWVLLFMVVLVAATTEKDTSQSIDLQRIKLTKPGSNIETIITNAGIMTHAGNPQHFASLGIQDDEKVYVQLIRGNTRGIWFIDANGMVQFVNGDGDKQVDVQIMAHPEYRRASIKLRADPTVLSISADATDEPTLGIVHPSGNKVVGLLEHFRGKKE